MKSTSSTLHIPDDMIETFENSDIHSMSAVAPSLQPKSLRSLTNFTKVPSSSTSSEQPEQLTDTSEPELQHGATTFVALESDLGVLFGPPVTLNSASCGHSLHSQKYSRSSDSFPSVQSTRQQSSLSKSFSRSDFENELAQLKDKEQELSTELVDMKDREVNFQREMTTLKSTIEQLELDNIDLSEEMDKLAKENKQLREDGDLQVQDIQSTMQDLKMNLKEKEDDVSAFFLLDV